MSIAAAVTQGELIGTSLTSILCQTDASLGVDTRSSAWRVLLMKVLDEDQVAQRRRDDLDVCRNVGVAGLMSVTHPCLGLAP